MPVKPKNFLAIAHKLINTLPNDEIMLRTVINRSYYAIYHPAMIKTHYPRGNNNHQRVMDTLSRSAKQDFKLLANLMVSCRILRTYADYNIKDHPYHNHAPNGINNAVAHQAISYAIAALNI